MLSYPFAIVTDNHKRQKTNTSGLDSAYKDIHILASEGDTYHKAIPPTSQSMNQPTASSFANSQSKSNNGRTGVQTETFKYNLYRNPLSHDSDI